MTFSYKILTTDKTWWISSVQCGQFLFLRVTFPPTVSLDIFPDKFIIQLIIIIALDKASLTAYIYETYHLWENWFLTDYGWYWNSQIREAECVTVIGRTFPVSGPWNPPHLLQLTDALLCLRHLPTLNITLLLPLAMTCDSNANTPLNSSKYWSLLLMENLSLHAHRSKTTGTTTFWAYSVICIMVTGRFCRWEYWIFVKLTLIAVSIFLLLQKTHTRIRRGALYYVLYDRAIKKLVYSWEQSTTTKKSTSALGNIYGV